VGGVDVVGCGFIVVFVGDILLLFYCLYFLTVLAYMMLELVSQVNLPNKIM
jgi:hypothetical protein